MDFSGAKKAMNLLVWLGVLPMVGLAAIGLIWAVEWLRGRV